MNAFCYDGIWSREHGLYITGQGQYDAPERDIEEVTVPGRDGNLFIDNGRFNSLDVTYSAFLRGHLPEKTRLIRAWLFGGKGYRQLYDTYDRQYFRRAAFKGPMNIESTLNRYGQCDVVFRCHPFRFLWDGQETTEFVKSGEIFNPEGLESRPYIKIYGSGSGTLYIGGQTGVCKAIDEYVELDSETQNAFKGGLNKNSTVSMEGFPILQPGDNAVSWTGGIAKIEIIPRWCCI